MGIKLFTDDVINMAIGELVVSSAAVGDEIIYTAEEPEPSWEALEFFSRGDGTCWVGKKSGASIPATLIFPNESTIGDQVVGINANAFENCTEITKVVLNTDMAEIGEAAFKNCINLTKITINSVSLRLNADVFSGCSKLKYTEYDNGYYLGKKSNPYLVLVKAKTTSISNISVNNSTKQIAANAFENCSNLNSITFGTNLTEIWNKAFYNCTGLRELIIPGTVTSAGSLIFDGCSALFTIYCVAESKPAGWATNWVGSTDAEVFWGYRTPSVGLSFTSNNNGTCLVSGIGTCTDTIIAFPTVSPSGDAVVGISNWAFSYNSTIEKILVYNSITSIGEGSFYNCSNLKVATISASVTNFAARAFYNCPTDLFLLYSNAYYIGTIKNPYFIAIKPITSSEYYSCDINNNTKIIEQNFAQDQWRLQSITFPEGLIEIRSSAFYNAGLNGSSLVLPDSLITIGSNAFSSISKLATLHIGKSLASLPMNTFSSWGGATEITISADNVSFYVSGNCLVDKATGCLFLAGDNPVIPIGVTTISSGVLPYGIAAQGELIIPEGVISASLNSYGPRTVSLPSTLKTISFSGCTSIETVSLPSEIAYIQDGAFYNCYSLQDINISNNTTYESINGNLISKATHRLIAINGAGEVPEGVQILGYDCAVGRNLNSLTLPSGLKCIERYAAGWYNRFTSIDIPNTVERIESNAFSNDTALCTVYLPDNLQYFGYEVFNSCNNLIYTDNYYLGSHSNPHLVLYKKINDTSLTSFDIHPDCKFIANQVFENCTGLTTISIPEGVIGIGYKAFANCTALATVIMPNTVKYLDGSVFYGCSNLNTVEFSAGIEYLGPSNFKNCSNLTGSLFNEIYYLGNTDNAYLYAYKVADKTASTYNLSNTTKILGESLFSYNSNLTSINLPESLTVIGPYAFSSCYSLASIQLPNSIISICLGAFSSCYHLKLLNFPSNLRTIGGSAFNNAGRYNTSQWDKLTLPDSLDKIYGGAFESSGISYLNVPKNLSSIGGYEYYGSGGYGGDIVFRWCDKLSEIEVSSDNTRYTAISGCLVDTQNGSIIAIENDCTSTPTNNAIAVIQAYVVGSNIKSTSFVITDNIISTSNSNVFSGCTNLASLKLSNKLSSLGNDILFYNTSFKSLVIPKLLQNIGSKAFSESSLETIYCEAECKSGTWATDWLDGCSAEVVWGYTPSNTGLEFVSNNDGTCNLTGLGTYSSSNILIPSISPSGDTVIAISNSAFENQDQITSITLPDTIKTIGDYAFFGCDNIATINLSNALEVIGNSTFTNCKKLNNIILPDTLKSIGSNTFHGCISLTNLIIPAAVETVGSGIVGCCTNLATINCKVVAKPENWNNNWNYECDAEIIWNS